jgi:hypothetical protein
MPSNGPKAEFYLHEKYKDQSDRNKSLALYYLLRPIIPRPLQIGLRRVYAKVQGRRHFPSWPIESVLVNQQKERLESLLLEAGTDRLPMVNYWPGTKRAAVVLTHDVETASGVSNISRVREVERRFGLVSSWNFVPERYRFDEAIFSSLRAEGCEIGVHGLYHDGKLFSSRKVFEERLPKINSYLRKWDAVGFRSPALHRVPDWLPEIEAEYDSSYPDTDPFEPQSGGCCSIFPYFLGQLVELPVTMPQDHTLFEILRAEGISTWREKASWLIQNHGMVLVIVHPDYMISSRNLGFYEQLLSFLAQQQEVWHSLPKDVVTWWRKRAASRIVDQPNGRLSIEGPASEIGSIVWASIKEARIHYTMRSLDTRLSGAIA